MNSPDAPKEQEDHIEFKPGQVQPKTTQPSWQSKFGIPPDASPRFKRWSVRALKWAGILVGVLALGALLVLFAFYFPAAQARDIALADLDQANQTIAGQEHRIAALETDLSRLQADFEQVSLEAALMKAELEVFEASLAVVENNYTRASLSIDRAERGLQSIADLLGDQQRSVLADLQSKLSQAKTKVENSNRTALQDLRILSGDLASLKGTVLNLP
jgi:septal ring factor EnvC (AmiA/AmiB activator)